MSGTMTRAHTVRLIALLMVVIPCFAGLTAFAAGVDDQVELRATHSAGVPLHHKARGTQDFQRIPNGTRARVIEIAQDGRWLKLSLPDGRTGWVTSRYVASAAAGAPLSDTSPTKHVTTSFTSVRNEADRVGAP